MYEEDYEDIYNVVNTFEHMNIKEVIKAYRDIRSAISMHRKTFENFEKEAKDAMFQLETHIINQCNDLGVDSFKTEFGTAYKTTKTYARLSAGPDAKELREKYAKETGDFGLFTSHVNKTHSKELLDAGKNLAELGIDWIEEASVGFRKS